MMLDDQVLYSVLVIMMSLVFSAFFSAAETAITSLGQLKAKHLLENSGGGKAILNFWIEKPSRVLTTILFLQNTVNIYASAVATVLAKRFFDHQAISIATGVTTFLVLVFADIIPKSYAKTHSDKLSVFMLQCVYFFYIIFYPVIFVLSEFAIWVIKHVGGTPKQDPLLSEDAIEFMVQEGEKAGTIEDMKQEMLSGVFEFDETKVREIMVPRTDIDAVDVNGSFEEIIKLTLELGHSRLPVYENSMDHIVGVIHAKDILKWISKKNSGMQMPPIKNLMRPPFFTPESKDIMEVFKDLKRTKNHLAIVLDEYGGTAGLVTMEDILEEIVGEIQDEFDVEEAKIKQMNENTFEVTGTTNIDEFIDFFKLELSEEQKPEEDIDSIGGWVTHLMGTMPKLGEKVEIGPLSLEVTEVDRHRVDRLKVQRNNVTTAETSA